MKRSLFRRLILPLLITGVLAAVGFYVNLPVLNPMSPSFWGFIIPLLMVFLVTSLVLGTSLREVMDGIQETQRTRRLHIGLPLPSKIAFVLLAACFVITFAAEIFALPLFQAKNYAKHGNALISEGNFASDVSVVVDGEVNDIAIMDTRTAATMGSRQIGSLGTLATQYELGGFMTTTINARIYKVAPLGYGDFWKWVNRRGEGIPGYVTVDPVTGSSAYVELSSPMYYSDTAFFNENVARKMRFAYPTAITGNLHFEIDNDSNPYWVQTVYTHKVSLFQCAVPVGIITCDAVTGECVKYAMDEIPDWVSIAWPADDMVRLVNYAGWYSNGFINSVLAKTGVYHTTDDYGFKQVGDDLNAFTGITSAASDASNIGFILCDMHSGNIVRYNVYGAEEYSAKVAAEGLVMNFGYRASFPSLVNVEGQPVYIMALTDEGNLIKKYAMVDLQDYTKVAVGDSVREAWQNYVSKYENGSQRLPALNEGEGSTVELTLVGAPAVAVVDGNSYAYLWADGVIYCVPVKGNEQVLFLQKGDTVTLNVFGEAGTGVYEAGLESVAMVGDRSESPAAPAEAPEAPAEEAAPAGDAAPETAAAAPASAA